MGSELNIHSINHYLYKPTTALEREDIRPWSLAANFPFYRPSPNDTKVVCRVVCTLTHPKINSC